MLILNSLGMGYFAYALYSQFAATNGIVVDGSPYLPDYQISFDSHTQESLLAAVGCATMCILGIVTAVCKRPQVTVLYFVLVVYAGLYCH